MCRCSIFSLGILTCGSGPLRCMAVTSLNLLPTVTDPLIYNLISTNISTAYTTPTHFLLP